MPSLTSFVLFAVAFIGSVNAEDCSTEALMGLASSSNLASCTAETGLSVSTISDLTQDHIMSVCKSTSCMALMSDVASLGLGDCTIPGTNVSVQTDVLDSVTTMCGGSGSTGTMGSMDMAGSSSSTGTTNVGDSSTDSTSSSDKVAGGSISSSKSSASTVAIGCVSTIAVAAVVLLM